LQNGEELLPEDTRDDQKKKGKEFANPSLLNQLFQLGFSMKKSEKALLETNNTSVDAAVDWLISHPEDDLIDDVILEEDKKGMSDTIWNLGIEEKPELIAQLKDMGFTHDQALFALSKTDNNLERAVEWIFSHIDQLDQLIKESKQSSTLVKTGEQTSSSSLTNREIVVYGEVLENPKYDLFGVISHIGNSPDMGHYVCHIKKQGKWVKFNDDIVESCEDPPLDMGYIYFYQLVPDKKL